MKNTKEVLENVVKSLPTNREFSDMRYYLMKAINETVNIEKKKERKARQEAAQEAIAQQWKLDPRQGMLINPFMEKQQLNNALAAIDEMINAERQKLEQLKIKPQKQQQKIAEEESDDVING